MPIRCNKSQLGSNLSFRGFKFFKVNGWGYNEDSVKQIYPDLMKMGGDKAINAEQIRRLSLTCRYKREHALLHFCSATGARPEAITGIQIKHVLKYQEGFLRIVLHVGNTHEMITLERDG